ncbi:MAG: hypothetical protein HRU70_08825 [Phycisphaeraceae bacterium]|nr:MAG: hypothetical protein HRU70_08825 [Phycisphaeraceae bacterium]
MFANDRDLLVYEPNLFRDLGWAGQRLVKGVGSIGGTTLTMASQDVALDAASVVAGHVTVVGGTAYEVIARLGPDTLTLSRLRDDPAGPVIPPSPAAGQEVNVTTFTPQIAACHAEVLRVLGIEPDAPGHGGVTEASIVNPGALRRLECLGALASAWSGAAGLQGEGSSAWARAADYRARFAAERGRVRVLIDLDGDGIADATRRLGAVSLERA